MLASVRVRRPAGPARRVRLMVQNDECGLDTRIKSRTTEGVVYHPAIAPNGRVHCDCPHFVYRCTADRLGHEPTVNDAAKLCHHLQRVVNAAHRRGVEVM